MLPTHFPRALILTATTSAAAAEVRQATLIVARATFAFPKECRVEWRFVVDAGVSRATEVIDT